MPGWFAKPEVVHLSLPGGNWIDVKKYLTVKEDRHIMARQMKSAAISPGEKPKMELDYEQVGLAQVLEYVVDWGGPDLVNDAGQPVPYSEAALCNLRSEPFRLIFEAVQAHIERMDQESAVKNPTGETASSAISPSAA